MAREEENRIEDLTAEELKEVEAALAALVPRGDRIDRNRLMYLAGQRSMDGRTGATRARWAWPARFTTMSAVAATLLVMLLTRPGPQVVERIVNVPVEGEVAPEDASLPEGTRYAVRGTPYSVPGTQYAVLTHQPISPDSYHQLLKRVLERGMDAWEPPTGSGGTVPPAPPAKYRELLETLLESPST